jgi:predicted ribosomally synthesized peptide with nif11-like leader
MSEEQLTALLAKLKEDAGLRESLQGAGDLDAAEAMAREAGFEVSKDDWITYQTRQNLVLSDEELVGVAGGIVSKQKESFSNGFDCSLRCYEGC